ncbi:MAG: TIGR02221 family CRISPR-associated protein [Desulfococcaceae bacterium]|jgi:hypothetical protein|nr:TIGR02221 family CRISPR-associated protein [Desulfococcaceae bacterium]
MRKVYLSFLGLGNTNPKAGELGYRKSIYGLNGTLSKETEFVQVAEMELLGGSEFDLVLIAATQKSYDAHFEKKLKPQMAEFGTEPHYLILDEDFTPEGQWKWFEKILAHIEPKDELIIDLTHGYRAISIIFSTAVNFLQKARNIKLNAVYYGVFELTAQYGYAPIVDMKDFYLINEWADGVSRLVEDADARKLAEAAEQTTDFQAGELNDPEVISTFDDLTNTIRNVDVNNVAAKASAALSLIRKKKETASETGKILLDLVIDKFATLSTGVPPSGRYDKDYFRIQLKIIELLLEHRLYMQAYTVMREFIASLVMIYFEQEGMKNKKRKKRRPTYGEAFVKLFQYPENEWKLSEYQQKYADRIMPFYEKMKEIGVESKLRGFSNQLSDYRNGFDHAWTAKGGAKENIESFGKDCFQHLREVMSLLESEKIL